MDISVTRLNSRMALQVPTELPLGMVFVVGEVRNVTVITGEPPRFDLVEADMVLHCRLTELAAAEVLLAEGDRVRVGGHLSFEHRYARYYLVGRDVEVLVDAPTPAAAASKGRSALQDVLGDVKRRSEAASLAQGKLPNWVKEMAPPELRAELLAPTGAAEPPPVVREPAPAPVNGNGVTLPDTAADATHGQAARGADNGVSQELIDFVSAAMDGQTDLELTPDILRQFIPAGQDPQAITPAIELEELAETDGIDWLTVTMVGAAFILLGLIIISLIWLALNA